MYTVFTQHLEINTCCAYYQVKAAFTRTYRAAGILTPYSLDALPKKMAATAITSSGGEGDSLYDENEGDEEESTTDVGDDAMIKVKDKSLTDKKGQGGKVKRNNSHVKKKSTTKPSNKKKR